MAVNKLDITMMEDVGTSASQLLQRDGSGNIPAVDGSQITGITEFTTSTSDPVVDTNPSGGVGTLWYNKTGGEMYICTDATAGSNVWTNVGAGTGDIEPWEFGRTQSGYIMGGYHSAYINQIQKISFTTDGNCTDVADLVQTNVDGGCSSSASYGFMHGGRTFPEGPALDMIQKFAFASDGNSVDTGANMVQGGTLTGSSSQTHGYGCGGHAHTPTITYGDMIWKYAFESTVNMTDVANLTAGRANNACSSSSSATYGYFFAGEGPAGNYNTIDKWSFTTDSNATDVGDLVAANTNTMGASSSIKGYCMGGSPSGVTTMIQSWSFASDGNAVDTTQDLTVARRGASSQSSTTYGYTAGGASTNNEIDKFPYATSANATDVGDIPTGGYGGGGCQY